MKREPKLQLGLTTRIGIAVCVASALSSGLAIALERAGLPAMMILSAVTFAVAVLGAAAGARVTAGSSERLRALQGGLLSFTERDFSVRLSSGRRDAVGAAMEQFNRLGEVLRGERSEVYEKERMLETVLEAAPMAILLLDDQGRVAYSNATARDLLARGRSMVGEDVAAVLAGEPPEMRAAITGGEDVLFTLDRGGERETFHASTRHFELRARAHTLVLVKALTREVTRREALAYKNAVRILSHELNNSLAPISSLVHSGHSLVAHHPQSERLARVFETVEERVTHLARFLESYARLAKLPPPERRRVEWRDFIDGIRDLYAVRLRGSRASAASYFDPVQMHQVVLNLIKNATEAGSAVGDVELEVVDAGRDGFEIWVLDRGMGMTDDDLARATTPLYSTKEAGEGLGLALCVEIVEAHGGNFSLHRREGGGIAACCALPLAPEISARAARG
jgi:nitrogen fixation/metabolism regulation signal transduction histidine kinase